MGSEEEQRKKMFLLLGEVLQYKKKDGVFQGV